MCHYAQLHAINATQEESLWGLFLLCGSFISDMRNVTIASGAAIFGGVCGSEKSSQIPFQLLESWC